VVDIRRWLDTPTGFNSLALDAQGAVTVAGATPSADFPTTPGAFDTTYNGIGCTTVS
jgi:hypothetical protein